MLEVVPVAGEDVPHLEALLFLIAMFKFSSDGAKLLGAATTPIAGNNYRLAFWNVADRKLINLASGHKGRITGLAISPDGKTVATSSADTSIRLWDMPR